MKIEKIRKLLNKLATKKILVFSIVFYLLIPVCLLVAFFGNPRIRSSGKYICYDKQGNIESSIVLTKNNKIRIEVSDKASETDKEIQFRYTITIWSYRSNEWYKNYDKNKYEHLSKEIILLNDKKNVTYCVFFKVGDCLYSDYLLYSGDVGVQKCYRKA